MKTPDFTYKSYKKLLIGLMEKGYEPVRFDHAKHMRTPHAIIRHDVDLSTSKALEMAVLEKEKGIYST